MVVGNSGMEGSKLHGKESIFYDVDLLPEILCRLPCKSLMQLKSVCKSWRTLIMSRYFCLLWRQHHRDPGLLLTSLIDEQQHGCIPLSGPTAGVTKFEFPRYANDYAVQSCNGFLLHKKYGIDDNSSYWVYNPATSELTILPSRLDGCKIHARDCNCIIRCPTMAFDSYSCGRVVALAQGRDRRKGRLEFQVCVMLNQVAWRSCSKPFRSKCRQYGGVHWQNFVVWVNKNFTLFYDVGKEVLRMGARPPASIKFISYHLGESGGHLHFIHEQGDCLIINEMKQDLSGWLVKHKIELRQMESSLLGSVSWVRSDHVKFKVHCMIEDSTLVMACHNDVVLYRIRDHKSWKICEWEFTRKRGRWLKQNYFATLVHHHVETISPFHPMATEIETDV